MSDSMAGLFYLVASVCFILSLRGLSSPDSSRRGNLLGIIGMVLAVATTFALPSVRSYAAILLTALVGGGIGAVIARRVSMTALPQLVAAFHSLVGLAAVLIASAAFLDPEQYGLLHEGRISSSSVVEMAIGALVGGITFTASVIAFAKLQGLMSGDPVLFRGQHILNAVLGLLLVSLVILLVFEQYGALFLLLLLGSFVLGVTLIIPIGGADMPVVISMLNSYSGWAACGIGFTLGNNLLITTGALVGASGAILSYVMCRGMNRSIFNVLLGGFGTNVSQAAGGGGGGASDRHARSGGAEDAAYLLAHSRSVIVVPGYGMAVAQAQRSLYEMAQLLKGKGVTVRYAIHPVAGRMPGHMNVLLAEADVPYEDVTELEEINVDFPGTDVAFVIGANDVTNPAARADSSSPIYGMPILDVDRAEAVIFVKRSLAPGYAGIDNELFYRDSTMMLFGDAKQVCENIVKALKS